MTHALGMGQGIREIKVEVFGIRILAREEWMQCNLRNFVGGCHFKERDTIVSKF